MLLAILFSVAYFLFGKTIISFLTDIKMVVFAADEYLIWMIVSPLVSVWSFWFDGVFIGANHAKYMRNTMFFSMLIFFISYYLLLNFGNHGLWAAFMLFMLARGGSMAYVSAKYQLFKFS